MRDIKLAWSEITLKIWSPELDRRDGDFTDLVNQQIVATNLLVDVFEPKQGEKRTSVNATAMTELIVSYYFGLEHTTTFFSLSELLLIKYRPIIMVGLWY